jgi:hypothetical protein
VEAEEKSGHTVGQPHGDHSKWPGRDEREPHQRYVLEGISELADCDGRVGAAEVAAPKEGDCAFPRRDSTREKLLGRGRRRIGHARVVPAEQG